MALMASIYTTVVVALERYAAISRMRLSDTDRMWREVLLYVGPVVLFSVLFREAIQQTRF